MTDLSLPLHKVRAYTKCPNFAKYSWHIPVQTKRTVPRILIEDCYRDIAVLNKRIEWKTIRNRVNNLLLEHEPELSGNNFYNSAITIMESLRNWYVNYFRDGTEEAVCGIYLESELNQVKLSAVVDVLLIGEKITLIEFTEEETAEEILRDIGIKTKIYLLGKQNIKVNKIVALRCTNRSVKTTTLNIDNTDAWNYKTEQSLKLVTIAVKNKIFYPSPTSMCSTCRYKDICS